MYLTEQQRHALKIMRRAGGRTVRSNYTAEQPDIFGDWPMHWHTLDGLVALNIVCRVGRHYAIRDGATVAVSLPA